MLETVEGDALTVKVTGDGKDFGTYRRKAWQIVGTTLYEELIEEGKFFKGVNAVSSRSLKSDLGASSLSRIGDLVPLETTKISLALKQFMILGEPPVEAGELALRSGNEFAFDHYISLHRFDIVLTVLEQRNKATKIFGRQDVVRGKGKTRRQILAKKLWLRGCHHLALDPRKRFCTGSGISPAPNIST